jgi:geranylgeranyl pyrophosphate synthase
MIMNRQLLVQLVDQRLGDYADPQVRAILLRLATYDAGRILRNPWIWVLPAVQALLQPDEMADIMPFVAAWGYLYAATIRLDQLQDHDPIDDPLPTNDVAAQYNLLLTYAVLANSLLDHLAPEAFPPHRLLRLRRHWSDMLLRMASGQQRDLTTTVSSMTASLDTYEEIARAKTGAAFSLAFGGIAMLLSDDSALIATLTHVGELFGMLVQYADDVSDAAHQPNPAITLPLAFQQFVLAHGSDPGGSAASAFWTAIFHTYCEHVQQLTAPFSATIGAGLQTIFTRAFAPQSGAT